MKQTKNNGREETKMNIAEKNQNWKISEIEKIIQGKELQFSGHPIVKLWWETQGPQQIKIKAEVRLPHKVHTFFCVTGQISRYKKEDVNKSFGAWFFDGYGE